MDKFLKNYAGLGLLIIIFIILIVSYIFNPTLISNIPFLSVSSNSYKQACANYIVAFLDVNYDKKASFSKSSVDSADISKIKVNFKTRANLADKNNKIDVVVVNGLKANIDNDLSYKITCWINASFKEDTNNITSYDILKIDISKQDSESSFKILEDNY